MKVNRDVGDVEDGFVCFACREREEMKGEIGRLRQVVCELVEKVSGGVGRVPVHSQREVVNCCTQTEARVVTVCTTSQTELGVTGGKRGVCEPGESTQTKEVGCMAGGVVKDTAEWELVSGRRAYAKVVQQARVEVINRFAVLSGGDKVREETCVIGDSIVRLVDDVVCRKGPPKCVRICLPGAGIQDVRNRVASVVGPGKGGAVLVHVGTNDVDKKGSEEVMGRYRELVRELKRVRVGQIVLSGILPVRGGYTRNNRRISINLRLQALCQAEGVGFLNMWEHFEQGDGLFSKDGLHLNKRGAAVLGKGFLRALGDGIGQLTLN